MNKPYSFTQSDLLTVLKNADQFDLKKIESLIEQEKMHKSRFSKSLKLSTDEFLASRLVSETLDNMNAMCISTMMSYLKSSEFCELTRSDQDHYFVREAKTSPDYVLREIAEIKKILLSSLKQMINDDVEERLMLIKLRDKSSELLLERIDHKKEIEKASKFNINIHELITKQIKSVIKEVA